MDTARLSPQVVGDLVPDNSASSSLLRRCGSWGEIRQALDGSSEAVKGAVFELLAKEFLLLSPAYDFEEVWDTHGGVPKSVLKALNLFGRDVTGIDLVAKTRAGTYWAIQAKYHHDEARPLSRKEATGVLAGRNRAPGKIELALICTTANGRSANLAGEPRLEFLMGDVWRGLDSSFFARLHKHLDGLAPPPPQVKHPRPHQRRALKGIARYFGDQERGKVVMPCATGKSLIGFWAAERLGARRSLVAVPNLSLVRQLLKDWTEQSVAKGIRPSWAVVCSDDSVADMTAARDLGVKVDTDPNVVASWLRSSKNADRSVVFTTYQSGRVVAAAARKARVSFDLGIFDEAHRTAGREGAPFAHLLDDDNVKVEKRVFMTATPRIFKGKSRDDVISMDDPAQFGGEAFRMTFLQAMEEGIIPNLTIVAVTVAEKEVERLLQDRRFVRLQAARGEEVVRVEDLVSALALRKAMMKYGIRRTLGFYHSKKRCHLAEDVQRLVEELFPEYGRLDVFHVDGEMTSAERDSELRDFEKSSAALMTNVRVFVEGVDCPAMDAVIFADPRQSTIDIVQGVGRALRPYPGKESGFAIIPTVIDDQGTPSNEAYDQVVRISCALASENELIPAYFEAIAQGKPWSGRRVFEVLGDVAVGLKVDLEKVNNAISVRTYERTVEWRPFEQARRYARSLELKSLTAWQVFSKAGGRDIDVPSNPDVAYRGHGWRNWGDWLGTGTVATWMREYRPFREARTYARSLGIRSASAWYAFGESGRKPDDIPVAPNVVYSGKGWSSWGDWLGTGTPAPGQQEHRPFTEARAFAWSLGLKSGREWKEFARSEKLPNDIPADPRRVYRKRGWRGMGDWLGTGTIATYDRRYRPFREARAYARSLGLKSRNEWNAFAKSEKRPDDIPSDPVTVYREIGWQGIGDWLGTGRVADQLKKYRPFEEARTFVRSLGLKSAKEWKLFANSGRKPDDIPTAAWNTYRNGGWRSMGDWLGTGYVAHTQRTFRPFESGRTFARSLGLKSTSDWLAFSKSGKRPMDIPSNPSLAYRNSGWLSMGDWLGTGRIANADRRYRSFGAARRFSRALGINSVKQWRAFCRAGKKPDDLPANPDVVYRGEGWVGFGDWLGTGKKRGGQGRRG